MTGCNDNGTPADPDNPFDGALWDDFDCNELGADGSRMSRMDTLALPPLAAMNVAMGSAYPSGDADFPLTYKCELTAKECDRPVRLEGIPISWGSIVPGYYKQKGEWSYRVNFNFEPTPETLIYMGATTSYRAGGWNMAGVESGDGKVAQCNYHPLAINPGFPVDVSMTSKQEYSDHGRTWNTTADRVGLSGPFTYQA